MATTSKMGGWIDALNASSFDAAVQEAAEKELPGVVIFSAPQCKYSKRISVPLKSLADELKKQAVSMYMASYLRTMTMMIMMMHYVNIGIHSCRCLDQ